MTRRVILFEYGQPLNVNRLMNYSGGIYMWCLTPGVVTVTDDNGNTGYYTDQNTAIYQVEDLKVDNVPYIKVDSIADLYSQDEAFYYDTETKYLYIAFYRYQPKLNKKIYVGVTVGFSKGSETYRYNDIEYKPLLSSVVGIKKSKDAMFYGILKRSSGTVKLINTEGGFDNFGEMGLYNAQCRILIGNTGDDYSAFRRVFTGFLGNYSYTWNDISIKVEDLREGLSNPIPTNKYTKSEYPYLSDSDVDKKKPIAYGSIRNAKCVCLNSEQSSPASYTFHFMDTEHHAATSISKVYVDGSAYTPTSINLASGTFTLAASTVGENKSNVTADFIGANITNGVSIIKDLMDKYAGISYIAANYNLTEMVAAQASARNTSYYTGSEVKLEKAIEQICVDIDALFFPTDSGLFSMRLFSSSRTPSKTIKKIDWVTEASPDTDGNIDEFLSSVEIKYNKNQNSGEFKIHNNTTYESETYDRYKKKQSKAIETGLAGLAEATAKSESVMSTSRIIKDITKRGVNFDDFNDIEIMDFVICDPKCRRSGTEVLAKHEVIGLDKNFDDWKLNLTLRYIEAI